MSNYDSLPKGSRVKLWGCKMEDKKVGDRVGRGDYIVLLQEGGYVRVKDNVIEKIVENYGRKLYYPEDFPTFACFDKWGNKVKSASDLEGTGTLGHHYYWYHSILLCGEKGCQ